LKKEAPGVLLEGRASANDGGVFFLSKTKKKGRWRKDPLKGPFPGTPISLLQWTRFSPPQKKRPP